MTNQKISQISVRKPHDACQWVKGSQTLDTELRDRAHA